LAAGADNFASALAGGEVAVTFSSDTGTDFGCGRARGPGRLAAATDDWIGTLCVPNGTVFTSGLAKADAAGALLIGVVVTGVEVTTVTSRGSF